MRVTEARDAGRRFPREADAAEIYPAHTLVMS
jgi:hypothetical protein